MVAPSTSLLLRRAGFCGALAVVLGVIAWMRNGGAAAGSAILSVLALGGALGGVVFHYLEPFRQRSRAWRVAADVAGALGYAVIVGVAFMLGTGASR